MKDFLGKELQIGDKVVFAELRYRHFLIGTIIKITPKTVLIEHKETSGYIHKKTSGYIHKTKQFPNQVIKI